MTLIYGAAAVAILWWFLSSFTNANPATVAKVVRVAGGVLLLGAAGLLGLRGRFDIAVLLGGAGLWLLGWSALSIPGFGATSQRTSGGTSRVRSALIEMELDHDTGEMDGSVLAGPFAGRRLASFDEAGLHALLAECRVGDPDGVRLLEAYLDRRFPQWRDGAHASEQAQPDDRTGSGALTEEEAYQILGLQPGADPDEIRRAHRTLMMRLHPDQGGSTYLAARVNQAKDFLLHRRP
jgi:DnaJ-like protein